eukprot:TRINITY_DN13593_c0_g1_i1.p1 TRINITY_DN13593_c0_g1~~TRINITY_DN13593_c0_g1_i1.p1  ORF type:complete len:331 (+),score=84.97 TRINITY_DN13593_c0_g1_i1:77-1069(+)
MAAALQTTADLLHAFSQSLIGNTAVIHSHTRQLHDDLIVGAVLALGMFILNWATRWMLVEPLARWVLRPAPSSPRAQKTQKAKLKRDQEVQKFAQSAMEAIFYFSFACFGLLIVPRQTWFWPSSEWWRYDRPTVELRDDLRCYYIMYCSRYIQGGISVLLEHRRKDFIEMCIHHWVTVILVALSYTYGWVRVGAVVMVLLDPADVPLHIAKMCKYIADSKHGTGVGRAFQFCADRWFELFAVAFAITRCGMYAYCCWSAQIESERYTKLNTDGWICCGLLDVLLVLQYYWMYLIIVAAIKMARNGGIEDVRSDDEGDGSSGSKAETKKQR